MASLLGAACWIDADRDEPPATDSETTSGSTATDDATVRFADTRACFSVDDGCAPLDDLHGFATDVDTRVLQAWADQASGAVHLLEEIDPQPWPLDLPWGDGGTIQVEASQWRQLDGDWFVDGDDRLAHVRRQCTGADGACNRWTLDITVVTVVPAPLHDDDLAQAWELLGLGLAVFVPFDVSADAFAAVAEAHVLALPHTPGGKTRLVTFVAIARTNLVDPIWRAVLQYGTARVGVTPGGVRLVCPGACIRMQRRATTPRHSLRAGDRRGGFCANARNHPRDALDSTARPSNAAAAAAPDRPPTRKSR